MKQYILLLVVLTLNLSMVSCKESKKIPNKHTVALTFSDTTIIKNKKYVLSVFKTTDSGSCFTIEREDDSRFHIILRDRNFAMNNSGIEFMDYNHDGFDDIIWTKKWQRHAYLFNPVSENFVEVGEYHDVDTLKINNRIIYYKELYPILYLVNEEKWFGWMVQKHSELFTIDSNYQKILFATLDNMSSTDSDKIDQLREAERVFVNCYVPPYEGRYGPISIWNIGKSVDSFTLKSKAFTDEFIKGYWQKHYKSLLDGGELFKVRSEVPVEYYK